MPDADAPVPSPTAPVLREGVTLVITELVRPSRVQAYEDWARGLHATLARQPGFVGVHVLRGHSSGVPEYVTLLRFASAGALAAWRDSPEYRAALAQLPDFTAGEVDYRESVGLEAWFDRPAHPAPAPPFWKNVVLGVVGVYPLILIFSLLFTPYTRGWPWYLAILSTVIPATIFLNWPVLPLLSRWCRGWLYPER